MFSLARVTMDAYVAFRALLSGREQLGPRFASLVCPTVVAGPARAEDRAGGGDRRSAARPDRCPAADAQRLAETCAAAMWATDRASQALGMRIVAIGPGEARAGNADATRDGERAWHVPRRLSCSRFADSAFAFACNSRNQRMVAAQGAISLRRAGEGRRHG